MLDDQTKKDSMEVGVTYQENERSCSFLHKDHKTLLAQVNKLYKGKVEIIDIFEALEKYPWAQEYRWKLIKKDQDEYTKKAEKPSGGYFIRIMKNAKVDLPIESCLMISEENIEQKVHNIIIAEEGSQARIITGCTSNRKVELNTHIGISEFYIKKNAFLHFTMIHKWGAHSIVRPRSAAKLEENGVFVSNYINLDPVKDFQMNPIAFCEGEHSKAIFNTILLAQKDSTFDLGSRIIFKGKHSRGEILSRVVADDQANVIARGLLASENSPIKGHLECRGLILKDGATIHAIPELIGSKKEMDLSHEAAVGKIDEREIEYLLTRGLNRDEAVSAIVRGFLSVKLEGLPEKLNQAVQAMVDKTIEGL